MTEQNATNKITIDDLIAGVFQRLRALEANPDFPRLTRGLDLYESKLTHSVQQDADGNWRTHMLNCEKCHVRKLLGLPRESA
jgi:hypothetical protein